MLEALTSADILNKIVPILSEKIGDTFSSLIEDRIQATIASLNEVIESHQQTH